MMFGFMKKKKEQELQELKIKQLETEIANSRKQFTEEINKLNKELQSKSSPKTQDIIIQDLEKEHSLIEKLNYYKIPERRPWNQTSFEIEKQIYKIFSSKEDTKGRILVELVISVFEKMGYKAKNNDGFKDKKKDILVYEQDSNTPFLVIQCKSHSPQTNHTRTLKGDVSSFLGYTEEFKGNRIFITSSYFDKGVVRDFSDKVILIDRIGLIHLLTKYFPKETANALNNFSLYEIENNCEKCTYGKLQLVYYTSNKIYKCTNCFSRYSIKNKKIKFAAYDGY